LKDLKVSLGNHVLENVGITLIKLANNGRAPINRTDFDRPLNIDVIPGAQLLRSTVESQTPGNLKIETYQEGNSVFVKPVLLNPNDSFVIQLVTTRALTAPKVSSRISGVQNVERVEHPSGQSDSMLMAVVGCALLVTYGVLAGWITGSLSYVNIYIFLATVAMNIAVGAGGSSLIVQNLPIIKLYKWESIVVLLIVITGFAIVSRRATKQMYLRVKSSR
jgi:hypothetical protein